jgi:hypothetical protein
MERLAPLACLIALAACRPPAVQELSAPVVLETPVSALPEPYSLVGGPTTAYLAYNDRDTRALVLAALDGTTPPAYLDRVTDLPEQDPLAGTHLLFADGGELHLLYLDRQSEDSLLLKYMKKGAEAQTPWIDVLPAAGKPVAAFAAADGSLDLFVEKDQALHRYDPQEKLVRAPFHSEGRAARLAAEGFQGFTVFDSAAHRLLLFRLRGQEVEQLEVARFGKAHDSAAAPEGRIQILAYDPRSYRILLFETADPASGFRVRPVTLSRGTTSVALLRLPGGPGFLFDELSTQRRRRWQISLLHPSQENGYLKTVLYRSERPVAALQAVAARNAFFVAFLEENLRVIRVDYSALRQR